MLHPGLHHFGRRSLSLTAGELASVAVVGVGGVGGPVAAALATAGKADVTVVARGETRKKLRKAGLVVELTSGGVVEDSVHVRCSSSSTSEHQQPQHQPPTFRVADAREEELSQAVGEQDFVVLCMKQGDQLRDAAKLAQPLLGPSTTVVTLQNGLPFWYFAGCASHEYLPRLQRLQSADPDGSLSAMLPPDSILGGAVYISGTRRRGDSSGNGAVVVDNNQHGSNVLVIGDATGAAAAVAEKGQEREQQPAASQRARSFRGLFAGGKPVIDVQLVAGPEATRNAVWDKLVANLSYNCLSALTGASGRRLSTVQGLRLLGAGMIDEAMAVAHALPPYAPRGGEGGRGLRFTRDAMGVIDHIARRHPPGSHKLPSMRQDIEGGVPTERGVIIEAIQEMGEVVGVPTPTIDVVVPLLKEVEATSLRGGEVAGGNIR